MTIDPLARADALLQEMVAFCDHIANVNRERPWVPYDGCRGEASYRTVPVPGAVLGGQPRNPEDDVIDAISELVDWQLENGRSR